jgi:hypothetical protein
VNVCTTQQYTRQHVNGAITTSPRCILASRCIATVPRLRSCTRRVAEQRQFSTVVTAGPICSQFGAVTRITRAYTLGLRLARLLEIKQHGPSEEDPVRDARAQSSTDKKSSKESDVDQELIHVPRPLNMVGYESGPNSAGDYGDKRITRSSAHVEHLWAEIQGDGVREQCKLARSPPPARGQPVAPGSKEEGDQRKAKEDGPARSSRRTRRGAN